MTPAKSSQNPRILCKKGKFSKHATGFLESFAKRGRGVIASLACKAWQSISAADNKLKEFSMDFIVFESCNFGVIDITPTSQAGQSISQELATKLASEYAAHFGYGAITQTHCDKSQEPLLARLEQILVLDDYLYKCDSGAILYNLGCVFCDLAQCKSWDRERAYRFLQEIYPQKVRANPLGFGIYAQRLVDKTQGSVEYARERFSFG